MDYKLFIQDQLIEKQPFILIKKRMQIKYEEMMQKTDRQN